MESRVAPLYLTPLYLMISSGWVLLFFIFYLYLKHRYHTKQFKNNLDKTQSELLTLQIHEKQLQQQLSALQAQSRHLFEDPVTQVLGWKLFEDRLSQSIKESARYQFTPAVLLVEIDRFKVINHALNTTLSHALLKEAAHRLQSCVRQVDSISRFKEETFIILLAQLVRPETIAIVAERILQAFAKPFQIQNHELLVSVYIGIAIYPSDGQEAMDLINNADHALNVLKEKGKQGYQFYQENMQIKNKREWEVYASLSRESFFQELALFYQPIMNVADESIFAMDALLYWQHPHLGIIAPRELFHYGEKQHKLNMISEWLLKEACQQFLHWRSLGFCPAYLAIPILARQLENSHFIYQVSQILQQLEFNPAWLLLEIREDFTQLSIDTLEKAFNMLKYMGVKIALDDVGSRFFSLYYLKYITVHFFKLDSFLIEDMPHNPKAVELIKSIIFLANNMGVEMIIQGIDSEEQIALLKNLGCSLMQGHLLGAPLSDAEVKMKMVTSVE